MFLREKAILHLHRRGIRLIEQEIGVTEMNLTEKEFVKFLSKFDEHPFDVKIELPQAKRRPQRMFLKW